MEPIHPAEAPHPQEAVSALRQALPRLNTSKAMNMWIEIRTFKALYSALRRVAGDIFLKYIDISSGVLDLPPDVRQRIREKAVLSADRALAYDTFDEAREYVVHNLERELSGSDRPATDLPPTIAFASSHPQRHNKGHRKQREMFGFLSDGDDTEPDQQQLLRSERKKVAEMSEALAAWYGPGWENELKRRKKELKARAREAEKEKERIEDEERRERERRKKEEAFPGVPLHSEQDSLEKLKKRGAAADVPAFPGIPLYDEKQRPRTESRGHIAKIDSSGAPAPLESAATEESIPIGKREKEKDREKSTKDPKHNHNAPLPREEDPTSVSPPARGLHFPLKASSTDNVSGSAAPPDEAQLASPPRTLPAAAKTQAFPGIPLHLVDDKQGSARRDQRDNRAKSLSPGTPGTGTRDAASSRPPDGKK